eukprot:2904916-Amphidinium_carterae.1
MYIAPILVAAIFAAQHKNLRRSPNRPIGDGTIFSVCELTRYLRASAQHHMSFCVDNKCCCGPLGCSENLLCVHIIFMGKSMTLCPHPSVHQAAVATRNLLMQLQYTCVCILVCRNVTHPNLSCLDGRATETQGDFEMVQNATSRENLWLVAVPTKQMESSQAAGQCRDLSNRGIFEQRSLQASVL